MGSVTPLYFGGCMKTVLPTILLAAGLALVSRASTAPAPCHITQNTPGETYYFANAVVGGQGAVTAAWDAWNSLDGFLGIIKRENAEEWVLVSAGNAGPNEGVQGSGQQLNQGTLRWVLKEGEPAAECCHNISEQSTWPIAVTFHVEQVETTPAPWRGRIEIGNGSTLTNYQLLSFFADECGDADFY